MMGLEGPVSFEAFNEMASEVAGEDHWHQIPLEDREMLWTSTGSPERETFPAPLSVQAADAALEDIADEMQYMRDKAAFVEEMQRQIRTRLGEAEVATKRFARARHHLYLRHLGARPAAGPGASPGRA